MYTKENNRAQGFAVGRFMFTRTSHTLKATFDFEQCTSLVEKMKNYAARLNFKWDLAGYNECHGQRTFEELNFKIIFAEFFPQSHLSNDIPSRTLTYTENGNYSK